MEGGRGQLGVEIRASLWTGVLGTLTPDGLSVSDCRGLCVFVESGKEKKMGYLSRRDPLTTQRQKGLMELAFQSGEMPAL